jgi:uncharacterized protein YjbI with pentapeptide repeats
MQGAVLNRATGKGLVLQYLSSCDELQLIDADLPSLRCDSLSGSEIDAEGLKARNADFNECSFSGVKFLQATLSSSRWQDCHIDRGDFNEAKLDVASFSNCSLVETSLERVMAENLRVIECRLPKAKMSGFAGRSALFRDCNLSGADLSKAYLYRAIFTGDPARGMCMRDVDLQDAILVQAYITADLRKANLRGASCAYARLNNCNMQGANLSGVNVYEASLVKTDLTDSQLTGVEIPFFADRCPGLLAALENSATPASLPSIVNYLSSLEKLLLESKNSST